MPMQQSIKHTRREFLRGAGALAAGVALSGLPAFAAEPRKKPNVVFVFADQLRAQAVGCYGDRQARTPNIDRLAAEGARFTNAVSTYPICSPFRAMLMTGRYPMSNGVVYNDLPLWDGQESIATVLKAQGYRTGYIGKWHLAGGVPDDLPGRHFGFDDWMPLQVPMFQDKQGKQVWKPEVQTDAAVKYIEEHKDEPFCLFVSWNPPHSPYIAPDRYMKLFPEKDMKLRPNVQKRDLVDVELKRHPLAPGDGLRQQREKWRKILDSDDGVRGILSGYYAATHGIDGCVGRIMEALEEQGIADDTILIFSSDHGDMMGSQRMVMKQEPFEESIGIPFVVRYPRSIPKGTVTDALLSPMDMTPTMLALAGAPIPGSMEGISLADSAKGKRNDDRDALLIMKMQPGGMPWTINAATPWRGVRTKTHTYARLEDNGPWVLFDNKKDPYQMNNLVNKPEHKALQDEMESKLKALLTKAHDPFNSDRIAKDIAEKSKKNLKHQPRKKKGMAEG